MEDATSDSNTSQPTPDPSSGLLALAEAKFGDALTDADRHLFAKTAAGEEAVFGDGELPPDDPGPDRVLPADRIRWLCTDPEAVKHVHSHEGVCLRGATVEGELQLGYARIAFPLAIQACLVEQGIRLDRAHLMALYLDGSHTGPIVADALVIDHDCHLRHGFMAKGEVRVLGGQIGGILDCTQAQFINPDGWALTADGVKVKGDAFLSHGFRTEGEVRLPGAEIGGNLECDDGHFSNAGGNALNADLMKVAGSVFMRGGFKAEGEVRLLGAEIGGTLDCVEGYFINLRGYAINAYSMRVTSSAFLRGGFKAEGEVCLASAEIGGNLECTKGHFSKPAGTALNAQTVTVTGSVFLRGGFRANGVVDFTAAKVGASFQMRGVSDPNVCPLLLLESAKIGTLWDDQESWPGALALDGFVYDRLHRKAPLDANTRVDDWIGRNEHDQYLPQPYEQLAKVFDEMGLPEQAKRVRIAKEEDPARVKSLTRPRRILHAVLGATIVYGYRPWRAAYWMAAFLVIGTFVSYFANKHGGLEKLQTQKQTQEKYAPEFYSIVYSLDAFVPIIDLHQAKYRLPTCLWLWIWLWFHIAAGWLLTTLLIVGLTGLVHR